MPHNSIRDYSKITTIKLDKPTKDRLERLRSYPRETYDEIIQKMLELLNLCRFNPEAAQRHLATIDREKRKKDRLSKAKLMQERKQTNQIRL